MKPKKQHAIFEIIWHWVDSWVIGENFCPFAKPVRNKKAIHIALLENANDQSVVDAIQLHCKALRASPSRSTTLLVLWRGAEDFYDYLGLVDLAASEIAALGLSDEFQLATFHPDYVFDSEPKSSPTNFTNRSPLPILHVLRESEITLAIPSQKEADAIVERNQARCWENGHAYYNEQFKVWQAKLAALSE